MNYETHKPCLYDGIKLRVFNESYFDFILKNANRFNILVNYSELSEPILPAKTRRKKAELHCSPNIFDNIQIELKHVYYQSCSRPCVEIKFSLHKMKNKWEHNGDDFSFPELLNVLNEVADELKLPIDSTHVVKLEIGRNCSLSIPGVKARAVVENLVYHSPRSKSETLELKDWGRAGFSQYCQNSTGKKKFYVKSEQYKHLFPKKEIVRFEKVITTSREIQRLTGIRLFSDLYRSECNDRAIKVFRKFCNNLIVYQPDLEKMVSPEDLPILIQYRNPDFWQKQWGLSKSKDEFFEHLVSYYKLIDKTSSINISLKLLNCLNRNLKIENYTLYLQV